MKNISNLINYISILFTSKTVIRKKTVNTMAEQSTKRQTTQWLNKVQKDRQHNGWRKYKKRDNTMAEQSTKRQTTQLLKKVQKDRQHNGWTKYKTTEHNGWTKYKKIDNGRYKTKQKTLNNKNHWKRWLNQALRKGRQFLSH